MGRIVSETKYAYLAGLFDGDGAIMAFIQSHKEKKFGFRVRVIIKITQKNPDVLQSLQKEFSIGSVVANRSTYEFIIRDQKEIISILSKLLKYLKIKNRQAEIALQILASKIASREDLVRVAKLADTLATFNVRSKNRRKNFVSKIEESIPRND